MFSEFNNVVHKLVQHILVRHMEVEKHIQVHIVVVDKHHNLVHILVEVDILVEVHILVEHQQLVHNLVGLKFFQLHILL